MRYEIKKILSCKILMISMIVAFIFSMAISYNAYANEKINLREFSAYIGDFSEQKYDVIEQKSNGVTKQIRRNTKCRCNE